MPNISVMGREISTTMFNTTVVKEIIKGKEPKSRAAWTAHVITRDIPYLTVSF